MNELRRNILISSQIEGGVNDIDIDNYLTIVALEDGLTATLSGGTVEYCVDGDGNWKTLSSNTASESINKGHMLSFRGNLTPNSSRGVGRFVINKSCDLTGNCNSLLFGDDAKSNNNLSSKGYAFFELFKECTTIKNVSSNFLPATILSTYCYGNMFYNCTSLTTPPQLSATTLSNACYRGMFRGTLLTTAPELPATTLVSNCYNRMFYACSKLNYIKAMFTTTPSSSYTAYWVSGVASSGTFVKNKNATWDITATSTNYYIGIPSGWTVQTA